MRNLAEMEPELRLAANWNFQQRPRQPKSENTRARKEDEAQPMPHLSILNLKTTPGPSVGLPTQSARNMQRAIQFVSIPIIE